MVFLKLEKKWLNFFIFYILFLNYKSSDSFSFFENRSNIRYEIKNDKRKLNFLDIFNIKKNRKKNIIIGAIIKYPWEKIRNFFVSLSKVKFENCDFVMFVGKMSKETINKIISFGVTIYNIPDKFLKSNAKIHNYRFKLYQEFLAKNKNKYNMVFTADVRDTIFQKDIFKNFNEYYKPFLGLFLEDDIIKNQKLNMKWVQYFCPKANIWNETIICSGTILGTIDKFIEFCDAIWKFIVQKRDYNVARDQGIVNCLIYDKKILNNYLITRDNHGPVMTIGLTKRKKISIDNDDNILNYDGKIAAVIHQYDRKLYITKKFNKKFNDTINNLSLFKKRNNTNSNFIIIIAFITSIILIFFFLFRLFKKKRIFYKLNENFKKMKLKVIKNN